MRSLKGTLSRGVILGIVPVLLIAGTILYLSVNAQLIRQLDETLSDKVEMLAASIEWKNYGLEVDLEEMRIKDMESAPVAEYLHVSYPDGRDLYRSSVLEGIWLESPPTVAITEPHHEWQIIKGAGKVRSVTIVYQPEVDEEDEDPVPITDDPGFVVDPLAEPGEQVVIRLFHVAREYSDFMELFLFMLLTTGFGSILVLSLTVWLSVRRGAEPVRELASRIGDVGDDDLSVRLEEAGELKELIPIVHMFNHFLDRLEGSFNREKGFTSDAAHELRTPLAGLRSTIEVSLARERDSQEYRKTLERALNIVRQLESLVSSLLALARLESGQEPARAARVDLAGCVEEVWQTHLPVARGKGIEVNMELGNGRMMDLDRDMLVQVLDELFRNAVHYVDQGGRIRVVLSSEGDGARLLLSNSGSHLEAEDGERVFDRFWRGSGLTGDDTGERFGLGLPIVRKIVQTMGGVVEVESEKGGEFVVTVKLPEGE